jgi:hypothetical protein
MNPSNGPWNGRVLTWRGAGIKHKLTGEKLAISLQNKVAYSIPTMKNTSKAASEDLIFTLTRRKLRTMNPRF